MDDSKDTGPSGVSNEVREQLEEADEMDAVAFWFRMAVSVLMILWIIDWLAFDYRHSAFVLRVVVLLLQSFVET